MRIAIIAMMVLGLGFFALLGLLSIAWDLLANDHDPPPALSDSDLRKSDSGVPQARFQLERR